MAWSELSTLAHENMSYLVICLLTVLGLFAVAYVIEYVVKIKRDSRIRTRRMAVIAIFSAIAAVLMYFDFPLFFIPSFYKFDFSEIPVLICSFAYGPIAGVITELLKNILKLFLKGTSTAFVGELSNFILGCTLLIPSSAVYFAKKTKKNALMGMIVGTIVLTIFSAIFNAAYLLPVYAVMYGMPMDALIGMGTKVNSGIHDMFTFCLLAVAPFNLIKAVITSAITFVLYKPLSPMIHAQQNFALKKKSSESVSSKGEETDSENIQESEPDHD